MRILHRKFVLSLLCCCIFNFICRIALHLPFATTFRVVYLRVARCLLIFYLTHNTFICIYSANIATQNYNQIQIEYEPDMPEIMLSFIHNTTVLLRVRGFPRSVLFPFSIYFHVPSSQIANHILLLHHISPSQQPSVHQQIIVDRLSTIPTSRPTIPAATTIISIRTHRKAPPPPLQQPSLLPQRLPTIRTCDPCYRCPIWPAVQPQLS